MYMIFSLYTNVQDLPGVYSARAFVGWYNGLPEHRDADGKYTHSTGCLCIST